VLLPESLCSLGFCAGLCFVLVEFLFLGLISWLGGCGRRFLCFLGVCFRLSSVLPGCLFSFVLCAAWVSDSVGFRVSWIFNTWIQFTLRELYVSTSKGPCHFNDSGAPKPEQSMSMNYSKSGFHIDEIAASLCFPYVISIVRAAIADCE
jgi:hypothetical protein